MFRATPEGAIAEVLSIAGNLEEAQALVVPSRYAAVRWAPVHVAAVGELISGRYFNTRYAGVVRESNLASSLSYDVEAVSLEAPGPAVRLRMDARAVTPVRAIVILTSEAKCGIHSYTFARNEAFVLSEVDGETPATEAVVTPPPAVHVHCPNAQHPIEVARDRFVVDVVGLGAGNPWPTGIDAQLRIARALPSHIERDK